MVRVEKACIDCITDLSKSINIEKDLEKHKNLVFRTAMEAVFGPKVWGKIENLKKIS